MKKSIQILFLIFLTLTAFAQEKKDTTLSKIALGINIAPIYEPTSGHNRDWKYGFGLLTKLHLHNNINLNIGLSYDFLQEKSNLSRNYDSIVLHTKYVARYSFLNIPISNDTFLNSIINSSDKIFFLQRDNSYLS